MPCNYYKGRVFCHSAVLVCHSPWVPTRTPQKLDCGQLALFVHFSSFFFNFPPFFDFCFWHFWSKCFSTSVSGQKFFTPPPKKTMLLFFISIPDLHISSLQTFQTFQIYELCNFRMTMCVKSILELFQLVQIYFNHLSLCDHFLLYLSCLLWIRNLEQITRKFISHAPQFEFMIYEGKWYNENKW